MIIVSHELENFCLGRILSDIKFDVIPIVFNHATLTA